MLFWLIFRISCTILLIPTNPNLLSVHCTIAAIVVLVFYHHFLSQFLFFFRFSVFVYMKGCVIYRRILALNNFFLLIPQSSQIVIFEPKMHLLDNVTTEVYKAYFPRSISSSNAVDLAAPDKGSEHNYKKWPPQEKSPFFPADQICAEDPDWDHSDNSPPSLAARCIQTLARFFSVKPERAANLTGGDRAKFLSEFYDKIIATVVTVVINYFYFRFVIDQ